MFEKLFYKTFLLIKKQYSKEKGEGGGERKNTKTK